MKLSYFARSDLDCLSKWSLFLLEEVLSNSTGWRFWTQNSWSGFPAQMKTMHRVSLKLSDLQMNDTSNFLFQLESFVHLPLSPAWKLHRVYPKLSGHTVVKSASFVTLHIFEIRICYAFCGIVEVHVRLWLGRPWYFGIIALVIW